MNIIKIDMTHEEFIRFMCPPREAGPDTTKEIWRDGKFIGHPIEDGDGNVVENKPQDGDWITWHMKDGTILTYPVMDIWNK